MNGQAGVAFAEAGEEPNFALPAATGATGPAKVHFTTACTSLLIENAFVAPSSWELFAIFERIVPPGVCANDATDCTTMITVIAVPIIKRTGDLSQEFAPSRLEEKSEYDGVGEF